VKRVSDKPCLRSVETRNAPVTYHVILPFIRALGGDLVGLDAEEASDVSKAKIRAFNLVGTSRATTK
jgi:hypothetical protein